MLSVPGPQWAELVAPVVHMIPRGPNTCGLLCCPFLSQEEMETLVLGKAGLAFSEMAWNLLETGVALTLHWPEPSHMATSTCKGSWEM